MSSTAEKLDNKVIPNSKITYGKPRKVLYANFHADTFWPEGKLGAELAVSPQKQPLLKKLYVPSEGLYMQWHDGSECLVPIGNIKSLVFEAD